MESTEIHQKPKPVTGRPKLAGELNIHDDPQFAATGTPKPLTKAALRAAEKVLIAVNNSPSLPGDFINTAELCQRLDISRRTASNLRERGELPAVILGRLVRYHWPSVQSALLRRQKGFSE